MLGIEGTSNRLLVVSLRLFIERSLQAFGEPGLLDELDVGITFEKGKSVDGGGRGVNAFNDDLLVLTFAASNLVHALYSSCLLLAVVIVGEVRFFVILGILLVLELAFFFDDFCQILFKFL